MRRRQFNQAALAAAALAVSGCGGGGSGDTSPPSDGGSPSAPPVGQNPAQPPGQEPIPRDLVAMGTNFSGMEWALIGLRTSPDTLPNLDFTVPREADVAYMAANHFGRNRLPIQWEMLQPVLVDSPANASARAIIGEPGAFNERYAGYITRVLDAHASVGAHCVLDLHNFGRYKDFRFQPDGSVIGLVRPDDPLRYGYTTDPSQVFTRIFATAPGASLTPAVFADFWTRAATRWKDHPGLGGYCVMNEPNLLPPPGGVVESQSIEAQDLAIWPVFARAAIAAIRAVDPAGLIYLEGNNWGGAMYLTDANNPGWPLPGANIVYDVHSYVDAFNNGNGFDWDLEVAKNFTAGFGVGPLTLDTGLNRMRIATAWAQQHGVKLALSEAGMPVDDARFHEAFHRMIEHTWAAGAEIQSWIGGNHWAARSQGSNHVPGWHQDRTLEPLVAGQLKATAGVDQAVLFDDGPGSDPSGTVTIVVHARGNLGAPLPVMVSSDGGGQFSRTSLVIPGGPNGQDSVTFTPAANRVTTLTYDAGGRQVPPPRKVYSLADPVAHASVNLAEAGGALIARQRASLWDMAHAHTDFLRGHLAADGETARAVADSGFGSSDGNAMEMLNWFNQDGPDMGPLRPPVVRVVAGRAQTDHSAEGCTGFWCKKIIPGPTYPNPRNRIAFGLGDAWFVVAVVNPQAGARDGAVFHATTFGQSWFGELGVAGGAARARWRDTEGQFVVLAAPSPLAPGVPVAISMASAPGTQRLRVNAAGVASASATLMAAPFDSLLIGWSVSSKQVNAGFGGNILGVIAGPGNPSDAELGVMERYLAAGAGIR